jgi:hypothetical protein
MIESQFRDWIRAQMRALDERVKAVEARPVEVPRQVGGRLGAGMVEQVEAVLKAVKGGEVVGMAVVYVGPDGPITGWSASGLDGHLSLLGGVVSLQDDLLHPPEDRMTRFYEEDAE